MVSYLRKSLVKLSLVWDGCPWGGYVKIAGFIDESMDTKGVESEPESWELRSKPAWQRLIVMLGGIFVNLVLAWCIYSVVLFSWGESYIPIKNLENGFTFNEGGTTWFSGW